MRKVTHWLSVVAVFVALSLLGLSISKGWSMDRGGYDKISVDRFVKMMDQKDFILINVHVPYEGEIPGTDLLIPFNRIDEHRANLPKGEGTKIVVYCMAGPMGDIAAEKLVKMGYERVIHFQGGMRAWKKAGRELRFRPK